MNYSYIDLHESSCTRDDAISIMIGLGRIRILPLKDDAASEERDLHNSLIFTLQDYLNDQYELLTSEHAEAKFDKLPAEVIAEKLAALENLKAQIQDAIEVAPYVDDEIAKLAQGEPSALRIDSLTSRPSVEHYTYISVKECEQKIRARILGDKKSNAKITPEPQALPPDGMKPWWVKAEGDPDPKYDWYVPARYFARQLIKEKPALLDNRQLLASKVVGKLTEQKIYKRGGIKPFDPGTILKAFTGMNIK